LAGIITVKPVLGDLDLADLADAPVIDVEPLAAESCHQ
jgi:hypothetical protein